GRGAAQGGSRRAWYPTALPVAAVKRSWRIGSAPGCCRSASPMQLAGVRRGAVRRSAVNGVEDGGELCRCTDHCHVTGVEIDDVRPEQRNGSLLEFLDVTLVPGEVHVRPGDLALVAA